MVSADLQKDSFVVWLLVFLVAIGVIGLATGSVMEGAVSALVFVGFAYLVVQALF